MERHVDELGRVVLPKEVRKKLGIHEKDAVDVQVRGNEIVIVKSPPTCIFCQALENLVTMGNYSVCDACIAELNKKKQ